ncbi:MAG: outer membrane beta-barrel protein [Candidatus Zixiibacteriota bacterium]
MKKLVFVITALAAATAPALAGDLGVGVAGGLTYPVGQDDQTQGSIFIARGKYSGLPVMTLEPFVGFTRYGDAEFSNFPGTDGSEITSYGVEATFGSGPSSPGFNPFFVAGIGVFSVTNDQTGLDYSKIGWNGGVGFEIGATPSIGIDVRGIFTTIITDDGGSKKSASVTAGLSYYFAGN